MSKEYQDKYADICRTFRKSGLVPKPFKLRVMPPDKMKAEDGGTHLGNYLNGVIRVCHGQPYYVAIDTFLHELAHHISTQSHGVTWADAYSRVYKYYHEGKESKE